MADASTPTGGFPTLLAGLLTCEETAQQLHRSTRHVKRMAREGRLFVVRIGRTDYYDIEKSRGLLRGEVPPPAAPRRGRPRKR